MAMGPIRYDFVGSWEAGCGGEHGPSIAYSHVVTEHFGDTHESRREVDCPEDQHPAWRCENFDEHRDIGRARFTVWAVVTRHAAPCVERPPDIADYDAFEAGFAHRAHGLGVRTHDQLGAKRGKRLVLPTVSRSEFDDGGKSYRLLRSQAVPHDGEYALH
jgi:hypothetical protein